MKIFIWIAAVLLVIVSVYALLWYMDREQETILSYKECKVPFKYSGTFDSFGLEFGSAQRELAGCMCESYIITGDTGTSKKIMRLYERYGYHIKSDSSKYNDYNSLDSIVKYRKSVFDPVIGLD